jgi:chromosome segregation ATPase
VLVIGTVVAVVAAFGPVWAVRVGVVVAVVAAIVACVAAWREVSDARHQHAREMLATSKAHGAVLTQERRHNASVVDTLSARAQAATAEIKRCRAVVAEHQTTIETLLAEITTLHGNHAAAQGAIRQRESEIADLQETVRAREAELLALSEVNGQVRAMPRRMLTEHEEERTPPPEDELFSADVLPSVTDLVDVTVVLPNYEGERRLA